ncbi:MAG TPA: helix-turn-helix domain-containing protein [Amnibacterium sp.]|jgi:AcrR family transcriptional regulator|uniref:TetR/AcrR family transcriptional regulator n=1 Tax=Amnibacterium sp. TaxID=1872496 RepID=UPI002F92FA85
MSGGRTYDATSRLARAAERRARVLDVARRRLLADGYARTSLAAIATEAQVSPELIHKVFGGKAGLVRAIHDESLGGSQRVPAPERSEELQASAPDLAAVLRGFGALSADVAPLVAPIELLIREAAAAGDPAMTVLHEQVQADRLIRMRENAARLAGRGLLAATVPPEHAADVFWTLTSPELYEQLVRARGWTPAAYGAFIGTCLVAALDAG